MTRLRAFLLLGTLAACSPPMPSPDAGQEPDGGGTGGGGGGGTGGGGAPAMACTPDPARIAQKPACLTDEHCPCGAHCALGECVAECGSSAPCADGTVCNRFGRCRAPGVQVEPPARGSAGWSLGLSSTVLPMGATRRFAVRGEPADAGFLPLDALRAVASKSLEVSCDGVTFASECRVAAVPSGELQLSVRGNALRVPGEVGSVQVHSRGRYTSFLVEAPRPAPIALLPTSLPGVWSGSATLTGSDVSPDGGTALLFGESIQVPLRATVFAAPGAIELSDPSRLLLPTGRWVGSLGALQNPAGAVTGTLRLPRAPLGRDGGIAQQAVELRIEGDGTFTATGSPGRSGDGGYAGSEVLSARLSLAVTGLLASGAPTQSWILALKRDGDVPAQTPAPTVPAEAPAAASADLRRAVPNAYAAAWQRLARDQALGADAGFNVGVSILSGAPQPEACGLPAAPAPDGGPSMPLSLSLAASVPLTDGSSTFSTRAIPAGGTNVSTVFELTFASATPLPNAASLGAAFQPLLDTLRQRNANVALDYTQLRLVLLPNAGLSGDPYAVPCGARWVPSAPLPSNAGVNFGAVSPGAFDTCLALRDATGCTLEPSGAGQRSFGVLLGYTALNTATGGNSVKSSNAYTGGALGAESAIGALQVDAVCRFAPVPPRCAESLTCSASVGAPFGTGFGNTVDANTGQLACASGGRLGGAGFSTLRKSGASGSTPALLSRCASDVQLAVSGPAQSGTFAQVLGTDGCFSGRFFTALDFALADDANLGNDGSDERQRYAVALVADWLQAHAAIAGEALERQALADLIRKEAQSGGNPDAGQAANTAEASLSASLAGWQLLSSPRVATALLRISPAALAAPDYRQVTGSAQHPQGLGLAPVMLETLRQQVLLATSRLETGNSTPTPAQISAALEATLATHTMRPLALSLVRRARALPVVPGWVARAEAADRQLAGALEALAVRQRAAASGANPLGIEEQDLPLYFRGAQQSERFWAISDHLINNANNTDGIAQSAVAKATASVGAARTAWLLKEQRTFELAVSRADQADRERKVKLDYGSQIEALCGAWDSPAEDVLESPSSLTGNNCYVTAQCRAQATVTLERLEEIDITGQLCVMRELFRSTAGLARLNDARLQTLVSGPRCDSASFVPKGCPEANGGACYRCLRSGAPVEVFAVPPSVFGDADLGGASAEMMQAAQNTCRNQGLRVLSSGNLQALPLSCYQGSIGALALNVRNLALEVQAARLTIDEQAETYRLTMNSCVLLVEGNQNVNKAKDAFGVILAGLEGIKLAATLASNTAEATISCGSAAAGDWNGLSMMACIGAGVKVVLDGIINITEFAIGQASAIQDRLISDLQAQTEVARCFNDASLTLVGTRSATLRLQQASLDLSRAVGDFESARQSVAALKQAGLDELSRVRGEVIAPAAEDYWLSEAIDTFRRDMRLAKRAMYLAVRAYEYEAQASTALRTQVLDAVVPADLQAALDDLKTRSNTRQVVTGARPGPSKAIVSLRDDVLQLSDSQARADAGVQPLTPVERLRLLLSDPRYAVTEKGVYKGQRIPFAVLPLGTLKLGTPGTVQLLNGTTDCAERLWSLNATVLGQGAWRGASTFTQVLIEKANTFSSQWCQSMPAGPAFQTASVRPSRNLFREPGVASGTGGVPQEADDFTPASINASFNVDRTSFESDAYANGSSTQVAARGLYGDYRLFIPAAALSAAGLDLAKVDDVLIRFDYDRATRAP